MPELELVLTAFAVVFVAELGDKTQLVAFSMTAATRSPVPIFLGSSAALVLSSLLAALLGGAAANAIPSAVGWVSASLFVLFGLWLLRVERRPIELAFLEALALERSEHNLLRRVFARHGIVDPDIEAIAREEEAHAGLFRTLLRQRALFTDDINDAPRLEQLRAALYVPRGLARWPLPEAACEFARIETAAIDFYRFLLDHLAEEHHDERALEATLRGMIAEEERHFAILDAYGRGLRGGEAAR